jgi:hypothetical protein
MLPRETGSAPGMLVQVGLIWAPSRPGVKAASARQPTPDTRSGTPRVHKPPDRAGTVAPGRHASPAGVVLKAPRLRQAGSAHFDPRGRSPASRGPTGCGHTAGQGIRLSSRARGDGLGAVGRAELAQDVAHMFLDGVEGDHEFACDGLVRPARRQHLQHLELAAGQRVDDAGRDGIRPWPPGAEGPLEASQVAQRDAGGCPAGAMGRDQAAEQRGHRRALVGEDPHIALRTGQ